VERLINPVELHPALDINRVGQECEHEAAKLANFISSKMRMPHIYQPILVKSLLEHGGNASLREIAQAFSAHDESQIEY
jgi:hypothetical protein